MLPDRVSNPGPLTYESGALPIALRGPAWNEIETKKTKSNNEINKKKITENAGFEPVTPDFQLLI